MPRLTVGYMDACMHPLWLTRVGLRAARLFGALSERGINILSIAQGSSEYNISLVISAQEVDQAVCAVHATFGLGYDEGGKGK